MTTLGSRLSRASIVGVLVVMAALFWVDGPLSTFAQTDTTAPTISSIAITSDPDENDADLGAYNLGGPGRVSESTNWASGVYRIGDEVQVTVTFSENVTVTGSPQLELATDPRNRTAAYESAEGSGVVFSYTVAQGDWDNNGIAISANKLTLHGGSIKDAANNDADLSHNALAAQDGHKVDGVRPTLSRLYFVGNSDGSNGAYTTGGELTIIAKFTERNGPIRGSVSGPPQVKLDLGGEEKAASWDYSLRFNDKRTDVAYFSYVVQEGNLDSDGPAISTDSVELNGGFIRDAAGNDAVLTHSAVTSGTDFIVDAVAPTVSSIAITSDPGDDDTYGTGDKIEVTVTFSENMSLPTTISCSSDVVHCKAELELNIGGTARTADYQSHDGAEVVYAYTVQAGDNDDNGIAIGANRLTGQRIMDAAGKNGEGINDADLSHDAVADDSEHKVVTSGPTITGTAEMGETLTADTSGIVDIDGLDNVSFSYQWIRSDGTADLNNTAAPFQWNPTDGTADLDIDGATSATYTITATDVGHAIKVRVSYTDDAGNVESLTSSATVTVPIEVALTFNIEGTTVNCDSYNVHVVNVPYKECDDPISTDQGASGEIDVEIEIAKSVSSQSYKFDFHIYQTEDSLGHYMTRGVNDLCLGPGLAASALIDVTPDDGTGPFTYTDDGTIFELCPAGTFQLYVPWYRYNYTDQEYEYAGTFRRYFFITSDDEVDASIEKVRGITALYPDPPASHGEVQIEGTKQSEVLNRELTTFSLSIGGLVPDSDAETTDYVVRLKVIGDDGPYKEVPWCHVGNVGYSYLLKTVPEDGRWAMDAHVLGNCLRGSWPDTLQVELFDGSDLTNYSEPIVFHGSHIISYTGELLYPKYGTHEFIAGKDIALGALPNTSATGAPTISGTAQVGETLTADTSGIADEDGLDNATFSYQWLSSRDTAIPGATGSTYTLVATDVGKTIKVKVSFTDDEGNEESLTSSPTASVADSSNNPATGSPTISGTMQVGQTLTASTSGIADDDGLTNVSYTYQWIANDGTSDSDIQDATLSIYTLVSDDVGKTIKVKVSFSDDAENEETLTSAATDSVVAVANPIAGICDRTEQVQDAILGWLVVDDCADVTDAHLAGITLGLGISNDDLNNRPALSLESGDFAGLVNIEELGIYNYTMDALPEDIFEGLIGLTDLHLVDNQLGALPEDVFDGLGSLESLDLSNNEITALPEDVFDGLGSLESLDLSYNEIAALPEDVFDGLGSLDYLDLSNNEIAALAEDVFDGLGSLEHLELWANRITLPEDVFDGLSNLKYLRLSYNQLSALPDDVFDGLGNLVNLDIQENQLSALPEDVFNGLSSLEKLNLSYNEIATLPEDVFDGLGNLKSLRLDSNDLASLPEDVFDGLDSLTHLILSDNRIHTLPEDVFEGLGNLTYLALNTNQISVLPEDVFDELGNLTSLALDGNQLGALPEGVFDELGNLTYLSLSRNQIRALPGDFFDKLGNLTSLGLGSNLLGAVPEGFFDELGNLTYLSLSRNQIRALPEDVFDGLSNLNRLNMSENRLGALPEDVFDGLGNLNRLYLYGNQLSALPEDVFDGLGNLNELYLYGNQLSALPEDVFDGLGNLNILYLWGNPGTPFTLTADLERQGDNAVLVKVAEGVPFDMEVTLSATGGTLSAASVTIKGGTAGSEAVTVTRSSDGPVTVSVASAVFQAGDYNGIQAGLGEPLILGDAEGDNRPATGTPAISDAVQVGETLTVDTSGIADEDGLDNVSYSYQWLSSRDTEIDGATGTTYTLQGTDLGKIIKVRVTFTDDAGNEETLTSAATDAVEARPNSPATGDPTISGTAQVGETLTADASGIADEDGLTNATFAYQWLADGADITGATGVTYIPVAADEGKAMNVRVTFTDDAGSEEELTSTITASVAAKANTPATGAPTIGGTVQVGETLTADTSGISDADGLTNVAYSYQWLSSRDSEISGATSSTYTLVDADEGKVIKVRLTFTDDMGHEESLTSEATVAVAAAPTPLTANSHDVPTDHDGLSVFTFELRFSEEVSLSYKTLRDHAFTVTNGTVTRARRLERPGNIRWEISVRPDGNRDVTVLLPITTDCATHPAICTADGRMLSRQVELTVSGPAAARPNNTATGAPTISGTAQVGQTLTASTSGISDSDGLTNATFSYQWLSSRDTEIAGATGAAHALVETDEGKAIKVRVSFTDDRGNQETLTSAATGAVAAAPLPPNTPATGVPTITGAAQVGETLTADTTGISDDDGLTNATFSYQWLSDDAEINGATASTYTLVTADAGKAIRVMVSFTDDADNDEELTSAATSAVAAAPPPPNTPATGAPTITGAAQVGETLTADTTGISDDDGLDNATFAYQWLADDAEINGANASTYTLADDDAGKTIKVRVSFTDDAGNDEQLTSAVTGAVAAAVVNPPLTAAIHDVPSSHNGQDAFIFELRFSEPPKPDFSYRTVWDHAFTVTGGSVTYVRRLEPGKNVRWDITVTPDSSADVAIALNATTDCEADGAICTSDGERLPASISAIVSGPAPVGTVPVAAIASGTTPVAEGATVSFTISLDRAAPTALSVAVSVADAGGVLSGAAPRSVAFATSDNSKTITLPTRDDNAIKTASTVTVSLATGSGYTLGTATSASVSVTDNDTAVWTVSAQPTEIAEGGSSTITLAVANGKTFTANQTVSLAVTGTASGSDYSLSATELTLPAGASSVTATVTARDDASVESDETVIVTAIHDGQPIGSATVTIEANDVAVWTVSAQPTEIAEGGSSTITLAVANGKTFTANQTVSLAVTGTTSGSDYSLSATELTLPAGASSVTATVTARDDTSVESDETVIVTAIHDGQPIGSATVTIEANDVAVWTVSAQPTEIAEGGSSTITLAVANGKTFTANQTVSLAVTGTASGSDYSLSATELTLPAGASSVTATVTARDDASVESDETVIVTAIHDGQPIGSATVTIEANDVPLSNDATLSTLSLSGIDIGTFSSGTTDYSVIVEYDVASTTVTADPNDDGASVAVADANGVTYGTSRQVSLSSGDNEITVTVTAEDGNAMKVYTVTVTRAEPDVAWGERLPDRDIVLDSDAIPTGLWADDTNAWVISDCNVGEVNVYALSDGSKQDELSFTLADWSGCATALWSNGATLWVADFFSGGVRAYRLSDGARQSDQDLDRDAMLAAGNTIPSGLWSNGEIMWVADHSAGKVFAYRLLDWARVSTREFDLTDDSGVPIRPFGLWSNGETLLASNWNGDRVLAYDLSDGQRQTSLDIDTSASGTRNSGIWSDGETLWIVDDLDKRIYAYAVQGLGSTR